MRARLWALTLSAQDTFLKPPPMQLPSLLLAHGKLVSGPQLGPVRGRPLARGTGCANGRICNRADRGHAWRGGVLWRQAPYPREELAQRGTQNRGKDRGILLFDETDALFERRGEVRDGPYW